MSESNSINAETRGNTGKGYSRRLRADGRMPAIIYGGTNKPVEVSLNIAEFIKEYVVKGQLLYIEGRIHSQTWVDKNNIRQRKVEIICDIVTPLEWKKDPK